MYLKKTILIVGFLVGMVRGGFSASGVDLPAEAPPFEEVLLSPGELEFLVGDQYLKSDVVLLLQEYVKAQVLAGSQREVVIAAIKDSFSRTKNQPLTELDWFLIGVAGAVGVCSGYFLTKAACRSMVPVDKIVMYGMTAEELDQVGAYENSDSELDDDAPAIKPLPAGAVFAGADFWGEWERAQDAAHAKPNPAWDADVESDAGSSWNGDDA
jgi:hypothetical protein